MKMEASFSETKGPQKNQSNKASCPSCWSVSHVGKISEDHWVRERHNNKMSVTFQAKMVLSVITAIDMIWIKFVIKAWNPALLFALSAKCFCLAHSILDSCLCWSQLYRMQGELLAASQRSYIYTCPGTKILPSKPNTAVEGRRPALSSSLKRQLLNKFFWRKLRLDLYNWFWPCCTTDTQICSSVLLYPFIFGCHHRAFFFMKTTAITYLKAIILTTIFSYSVAFIQVFQVCW